MDKSPEQARIEVKTQEYIEAVTSKENLIGLMGHQPTLRKIRQAWLDKELNESELKLVLTKLAQDLKGDVEPFKSVKELNKYMFPNAGKQVKLSPITLSTVEQAVAIASILPPKKKAYSGPRKKKEKKVETINRSAIPAHLQHLF